MLRTITCWTDGRLAIFRPNNNERMRRPGWGYNVTSAISICYEHNYTVAHSTVFNAPQICLLEAICACSCIKFYPKNIKITNLSTEALILRILGLIVLKTHLKCQEGVVLLVRHHDQITHHHQSSEQNYENYCPPGSVTQVRVSENKSSV